MWRKLVNFFRRKHRPVSSLSPELREEALMLARGLTKEGVSVRALFPGEVPSETPELGKEPMRPHR